MAQAASRIASPRDVYAEAAGPRFAAVPAYGEDAHDRALRAGIRRAPAPYPSAMRRARRRTRLTALVSLCAVAAAGWAVLAKPHGEDPVRTAGIPAPVAAEPVPARGSSPRPDLAWMLDPAPALGAGATRGAVPPLPAFRLAALPAPAEPAPAVRSAARAESPSEARTTETIRVAATTPAAVSPMLSPAPAPALVPLPVARPPELLRPQVVPAARVAGRQPLPRTREVFRAAMAEEPSFFETLFGVGRAEAPRQALAYANPDAIAAPRPRLAPAPAPSPSAGVAVYDITARTVTLPGGEVLEAHSGLGALMDDPRHVHVRMRGSTPPATYDLTERESLFHGVRAIRLNPVGGSGAIHGRDGLLAHTYMLRQPGASNGCVSFRDYDRFLQAFLRGEVRRLVVVAGDDGAAIRIGLAGRPERRG